MGAVAALLLAAGESSRMGELKALLPWQGSTLLQYQVSALAEAGVSRIVVVLGHQAHRLEPLLKDHPEIYCTHNPDYQKGKITSVMAGLRALHEGIRDPRSCHTSENTQEEALLVLNVDQPRSPTTIRRLIDNHLASKALITIPTYGGKGGHPTIFSTVLLPELLEISEDTQGLKAVVRRHHTQIQQIELDTSEVLLDLNTPEDYQQAFSAS